MGDGGTSVERDRATPKANQRRGLAIGAVLALVLTFAGCSTGGGSSAGLGNRVATDSTTTTSIAVTVADPATPKTSATATTATTAPAVSPAEAMNASPLVSDAPATALVDRLVVRAPDPAVPDYRRKAFGSGWDYHPESGCNTRELVLITESSPPPEMGPRCKPISGHWVSLYDGVVATDPAALEIDHLVPLAEAWRSGAADWSDARREAFANDLTDPDTLVAVTSRSNRSKGDSSPDEWMPPASGDHCRYVDAWVRVKARWSLAVTPAEKSTLVQILSGC